MRRNWRKLMTTWGIRDSLQPCRNRLKIAFIYSIQIKTVRWSKREIKLFTTKDIAVKVPLLSSVTMSTRMCHNISEIWSSCGSIDTYPTQHKSATSETSTRWKMKSRTLANGMLLIMIAISLSLSLLHLTLALLPLCPTARHGPLLSFIVCHPASPPPLFASKDDGYFAISLLARSRQLRSKFWSLFSLFGICASPDTSSSTCISSVKPSQRIKRRRIRRSLQTLTFALSLTTTTTPQRRDQIK